MPLKIYQKREVEITTVAAAPEDLKGTSTTATGRRGSSPDSLPDGILTQVHVKGGRMPTQQFDETSSMSDKSRKSSSR